MSRGHGRIQRDLLDTLAELPRQPVTLAELTHRVHELKWPPRNGRNAYTRSQREAVRRAVERLADEGHVERDGDGVKLVRRSSTTRQRQAQRFGEEERAVLNERPLDDAKLVHELWESGKAHTAHELARMAEVDSAYAEQALARMADEPDDELPWPVLRRRDLGPDVYEAANQNRRGP